MKIAVLGGTGMLSSMLVDYLPKYHQVIATYRNKTLIKDIPGVEWRYLDVTSCPDVSEVIKDCEWVINAIGLIKQKLVHPGLAMQVNSQFPNKLMLVAENYGMRIIQIATDCVFSGKQGNYKEVSTHDPVDAYGRTKSAGEIASPNVLNLRCSIVGPEPHGHVSLLGWFLSQPQGAVINGYTNHLWNGVTTLQFAKVCQGVIENNNGLAFVQHLVPADIISKADLLEYFREYFNRRDITINYILAQPAIDRSLATVHPKVNKRLWLDAGYRQIPTIEDMVAELAVYAQARDKVLA